MRLSFFFFFFFFSLSVRMFCVGIFPGNFFVGQISPRADSYIVLVDLYVIGRSDLLVSLGERNGRTGYRLTHRSSITGLAKMSQPQKPGITRVGISCFVDPSSFGLGSQLKIQGGAFLYSRRAYQVIINLFVGYETCQHLGATVRLGRLRWSGHCGAAGEAISG